MSDFPLLCVSCLSGLYLTKSFRRMLGFSVRPDLLCKTLEVVVAGDAASVTSVVTDTFSVGGRIWHSST